MTHQAALSHLRNYFNTHPGKKLWRLVLMACLVIMLLVAMVPTILMKYWDSELSKSALCYFPAYADYRHLHTPFGLLCLGEGIFSMCVIVSGLVIRIIKLHKSASNSLTALRDRCRGRLRSRLVRVWQNGGKVGAFRTLLKARPCIAVWLVVRIYADVSTSYVAEVRRSVADFLGLRPKLTHR